MTHSSAPGANPGRHWSFESQCLRSTESFCEQHDNRALKWVLPLGKVEKVDYPFLWPYKMPPPNVKMLVVESMVLVTCWRAMRSPWHPACQRCFSPQVSLFIDVYVLTLGFCCYFVMANVDLLKCSITPWPFWAPCLCCYLLLGPALPKKQVNGTVVQFPKPGTTD